MLLQEEGRQENPTHATLFIYVSMVHHISGRTHLHHLHTLFLSERLQKRLPTYSSID